MSILIKGMEMPTEGGTIVVYKISGNYFAARAGKDELFPIVPVPPHGRLVSMDEIEERIDSCCDYIDCSKTMCNECAVQIVMNKVFDAPTIIPAEEEGEC